MYLNSVDRGHLISTQFPTLLPTLNFVDDLEEEGRGKRRGVG